MTLVTTRYVRKPSFVDGVKVTAENFLDVCSWCDGEIVHNDGKQYIKVRSHNPQKTRHTQAFLGDWVLYTAQGYRVFTDKAFSATFNDIEPELPKAAFKSWIQNDGTRVVSNPVEGENKTANDPLGDTPQPVVFGAHCEDCEAVKGLQLIGEQCNLPDCVGIVVKDSPDIARVDIILN